tara:strand:+ start:1754 stop:2008 length:255 start_codon:yes stop_codon:yes gene_type:complete
MPKKRDYKKEYREFHGKPKQRAARALRNRARKKMGLKVGDKREVDHIRPLSRMSTKQMKKNGNSRANLRVVSRKTNRKKGNRSR